MNKMNEKNKKFVIQKHSRAGEVHWDFMVEIGESLRTWRIDSPPSCLLKKPACAIKIFDHPLKFLTYEGSVNNGKGNVEIAETGTYEKITCDENKIEITLTGKILTGRLTITHIKDDQWQISMND